MKEPTIVFSCLFNEDPGWLDLLASNFIMHTPDCCHLIVNLQSNMIAPLSNMPRLSYIVGSERKDKLGAYLLRGHLESLQCALKQHDDIQYFTTIASNSLFFRSIDLTSTINAYNISTRRNAYIDFSSLPETWLWQGLNEAKVYPQLVCLLNNYGIKSGMNEQIEGLFASKEDWLLINRVFDELAELLFAAQIKAPLEEIFPVSIIHGIGSGRHIHSCKVFWPSRHPQKKDGLVELRDLMLTDGIPSHICMYKWFKRDGSAPETKLVTTQCGKNTLEILRHVGSMISNKEELDFSRLSLVLQDLLWF
jgi:hypothetical protein